MVENILGLDIGGVRTGVATARADVQIASPHSFITASGDELIVAIMELVKSENIQLVVAGMPRGMDGQETEQTHITLEIIEALKSRLSVPIVAQDESLTSHQAEKELQSRGKPFQKGDIDALAATYILQDYLTDHPGAV